MINKLRLLTMYKINKEALLPKRYTFYESNQLSGRAEW